MDWARSVFGPPSLSGGVDPAAHIAGVDFEEETGMALEAANFDAAVRKNRANDGEEILTSDGSTLNGKDWANVIGAAQPLCKPPMGATGCRAFEADIGALAGAERRHSG
jgi:hypothetical protein